MIMGVNAVNSHSQDDPKVIPLPILGADVSLLQRSLDLGAHFFDVDGRQAHPLDILKSHGINFIRLRCSFTGSEEEILSLNALFREKYRDRMRRITNFP